MRENIYFNFQIKSCVTQKDKTLTLEECCVGRWAGLLHALVGEGRLAGQVGLLVAEVLGVSVRCGAVASVVENPVIAAVEDVLLGVVANIARTS